jgi:molecular chaperone DnaK
VLAEGELTRDSLGSVLLVGGQTRTPLVRRMVAEHFGQEPITSVNPDEAVSIGAALLGESLDSQEAVQLIDVLPVSIGVGVPGGELKTVLPSGTPVPAYKTYALKTHAENQTEMLVPIFQGDKTQVDDNEFMGTIRVSGIKPAARGSQAVLITFALNSECLFSVYARDKASGSPLVVSMSSEQP